MNQTWVFLNQLDYEHEILITLFHSLDLSPLLYGSLFPLIHLFSDLLDLFGQHVMLLSIVVLLDLHLCNLLFLLVEHFGMLRKNVLLRLVLQQLRL